MLTVYIEFITILLRMITNYAGSTRIQYIYSAQSKYSLVRDIFHRIFSMKMLGSAWTTASRHTTLRYTPLYFQNAVSLVDHFLLVGCPPYHGEEVWVHTPVTLRAIPVVAWLLAGPPMLERSKGRRQT